MKRIKQKSKTGCGLACIAMLAGKSYEEVERLAKKELGMGEDGIFLTHAKDLRKLGEFFGIQLSKRKVPYKFADHKTSPVERKSLPSKAILATKYNAEKNEWHWVVYIREENKKENDYVLDPWCDIKKDRRTDFGNIKIKWYLKVIEDDI